MSNVECLIEISAAGCHGRAVCGRVFDVALDGAEQHSSGVWVAIVPAWSDGVPFPNSLLENRGTGISRRLREVSATSCHLALGRAGQSQLMTVYSMVVYEPKGSTGLRPELRADPNWRTGPGRSSGKTDAGDP